MSRARHGHTLRAPWYVLERKALDWADPVAHRPALQKYDRTDFVEQVICDPRRSLEFDDEGDDVWSFPVPVPPQLKEIGRRRFATHRLVRTRMRKLYQPNHDRFYAAVVELFCDAPGLPLPGRDPDVGVWFVLRRERIEIAPGKAATDALRALAPALAAQLDREQHEASATTVSDEDVDDVVWIEREQQRAFTTAQQAQLDVIRPRRVVEAWVGDGERGSWLPVPEPQDPAAPPELVKDEQEREMWRVPVPKDACDRAGERSLWFAPVPTLSGVHDSATGLPQLDDRSTYRILCFARTLPGPDRPSCPPLLGWAAPSEPFRLAAFLDPAGTKNHRVTIVTPDFRALAARLGEPPGPGGLEVVQPPGSQLKFTANRNGSATDASTTDFGSATMRCTFAIELLMIVAMFLFSLFLPVVVLLFQLWWLLLLRFCLPRPELAFAVLTAHFQAGGTIAQLPAPVPPVPPATRDPRTLDRQTFDEVLDSPGLADRLVDPANGFPQDPATAEDFVVTAALGQRPPDPPRVAEAVPDDPLCPPARRPARP